MFPPSKLDMELEQMGKPEVDPMTQSMYGSLGSNQAKNPGPFSAKRVVHESDTPHNKPQQGKLQNFASCLYIL